MPYYADDTGTKCNPHVHAVSQSMTRKRAMSMVEKRLRQPGVYAWAMTMSASWRENTNSFRKRYARTWPVLGAVGYIRWAADLAVIEDNLGPSSYVLRQGPSTLVHDVSLTDPGWHFTSIPAQFIFAKLYSRVLLWMQLVSEYWSVIILYENLVNFDT